MSEVSFFLKKLFLDFPELRLGRVGKQAGIGILPFFIHYYIKRKASETKPMNWKCSKIGFTYPI